jgi:hypothetical protein
MVVCSAQPLNYTEANATYALANVTMAGTDFTLANGDVSGRKATVGAKSGVLITYSGTATANHIALLDTVTLKVLYVTTTTAQSLTGNGSNTVNIPAWDIEIASPA